MHKVLQTCSPDDSQSSGRRGQIEEAQKFYQGMPWAESCVLSALRQALLHEERGLQVNITPIPCYRGEVYIADLEPVIGSEQGGTRPVVVVQCNTLNRHSPTAVVSPITSNIDKRPNFPAHVVCQHILGLPRPSMVLVEQSRAIAKDRMRQRVGYLTEEQMRRVSKALRFCFDLEAA